MYQKFIINQGSLKMGFVDQHKELADDHSTTRGGGWWYKDDQNKNIYLYSKSQLFGYVDFHQLKKVVAEGAHRYPGYTFYYSRSSHLPTAMEDGQKL